jgi:hypothetical protein
MDSDDPEARIRELEVGSFSENPGIAPQLPAPAAPPPAFPPPPTAQAWPPPTLAPPSPYGTGFGSGAPSYVGRRNRRTAWSGRGIVFVIFGLFMIAPLWNVAHSLFVQRPHSGSNSSANTPLTVSKGGTLSVGGNDTSQTIACNDGMLTVGGNNNTFTVTGHCVSLEVRGNDTRVTVDSADAIKAGGIDTVTIYHSGAPTITKTGINGTVKQG